MAIVDSMGSFGQPINMSNAERAKAVANGLFRRRGGGGGISVSAATFAPAPAASAPRPVIATRIGRRKVAPPRIATALVRRAVRTPLPALRPGAVLEQMPIAAALPAAPAPPMPSAPSDAPVFERATGGATERAAQSTFSASASAPDWAFIVGGLAAAGAVAFLLLKKRKKGAKK